jgi:hypothetical protein
LRLTVPCPAPVGAAVATVLGLLVTTSDLPRPMSDGLPEMARRLDAWRVLGPGGGGTTRHPAISPHDPRLMVVASDMTGSYITTDGGRSWRLFNLGGSTETFAFDPRDPAVIYAANEVLWRSQDRGLTWGLVFPAPERGTRRRDQGDHADAVYVTDEPLYPSGQDARIGAVAVDPSNSQRLRVALEASRTASADGSRTRATELLESRDRGKTWERLVTLGDARVLTFWMESDGTTCALTPEGVWQDDRAGWHRWDAPAGIHFESSTHGWDATRRRTIVYATSPLLTDGTGGLHLSDDGGRTWRATGGELTAQAFDRGEGNEWGPAAQSRSMLGPVVASSGHGEVAYVGLRGLRSSRSGAKYGGIARTVDAGKSWNVVHGEADRPSRNLVGSWVEELAEHDGRSVWFDAPYDLAVGPLDPEICVATDLFRAYATTNGGRTWAQVNSYRTATGAWTSRGLDVTTAYGVHFDPFDAQRVLITFTDIGLFRSEDGGQSWVPSSHGIPQHWRNTSYWVEFDPDVPGLVWGAFSGTHDLPRPKMWKGRDPEAFRGGVGISTDGARTWTPSWNGAPEGAVTHLLLDPTSPRSHRTLFAAVFGRGVYRSDDGGRSWGSKNVGLEASQPFAWRLSRGGDGALYLVVARRSVHGRLGDADDGQLYRSLDRGEHWARMALPAGTNGPVALTVDTVDPRRLYLSAWGVAKPGGDTGGGVFLSADGGLSWQSVLPGAEHVYDVTRDPHDPRRLYASGFDQSAWRSTDRGETWVRLGGYNFKWGHRVLPDPRDTSRVFVTTFGGSVWYGPAAGDPDAKEDVVGWRWNSTRKGGG